MRFRSLDRSYLAFKWLNMLVTVPSSWDNPHVCLQQSTYSSRENCVFEIQAWGERGRSQIHRGCANSQINYVPGRTRILLQKKTTFVRFFQVFACNFLALCCAVKNDDTKKKRLKMPKNCTNYFGTFYLGIIYYFPLSGN